MQFILFDDNTRYQLLPFAHTRPVADIRCGILTMRERWEAYLGHSTHTLTLPYLQSLHPIEAGTDNTLINSSIFATQSLVNAIDQLNVGEKLVKDEVIIAFRIGKTELSFDTIDAVAASLSPIQFSADIYKLNHVWDIFSSNDKAIRDDFNLITTKQKSRPIPEGVTVTNPSAIFIAEGAHINAGCIINAATGPVYIGKEAEILEGTMIRGPLAMCDLSVIKMGAKIYGATTIGPGCKVGGEINNAVFFANSNKAHDGYLGNAVIGEWCNLGADTNCSNLKNNYDEVKIWDEYTNKSIKTGLTFCGLLMGDHSKCSINTMFNTGTVVGVSCNIFGSGFPEKFVPSFCWGGSDGMTTYDFDRAMDTARRMMARRNKDLAPAEINMYRYIFDNSAATRDLFTK